MKNMIILFSFIFAISSNLMAQTIMNIHQSNGTVLQIPLNTIDSITYTINSPGNLAALTTLPIGNITNSTALSGGNITNNGGTAVTQRGIVWNTSPSPTTANSSTNDGSGTGNFTSNLTGLAANTTYYVRAYAINSAGTAYGNQVSFTTSTGGGTGIVSNPGPGVTYNGYNYPTIILGNGQEWMAQNLRTTQYNDGTVIPLVNDSILWLANANVINMQPMMCWYNNDQATYTANNFGALYNWYAISLNTNGNKNICPAGWHVPNDADWNLIINYLDPNASGGINTAGGKLKSTGTQYWLSPNIDATNEIGFFGYPGGVRGMNSMFLSIDNNGYWWSSTESNSGDANGRWLRYNYGNVANSLSSKACGMSIRCIKD